MDELLPCPFCGGTNPRLRNIFGKFSIRCDDCYGATTLPTIYRMQAIEAWNRRAPSPSQAEREAADRLQAQLDIDNALAMTVYRRDLEPVLTAIRARPAAPAGVPRSEVEALRDLLQKMAEDRIASANDATDRGQDIITGVASAYTAVAIRLDALLTLPTDPQEPAQAKEVSNQP